MSKRVLIVDDDGPIRELLARAFALWGWERLEAANGRIALEMLARHPCDLVVCDLMMPELHGLETIPIIERDYPDTPVIAMDGFLTPERCPELPARGIPLLVKPFDLAELKAVVDRVCAQSPSAEA